MAFTSSETRQEFRTFGLRAECLGDFRYSGTFPSAARQTSRHHARSSSCNRFIFEEYPSRNFEPPPSPDLTG